jgi:hypothetical protein
VLILMGAAAGIIVYLVQKHKVRANFLHEL